MSPNRDESAEFRLRSVAVAAYAPAALFGIGQGAILPVIVASSFGRGASVSTAAFVGALIGIGSLVTNIPSGILATRVGERRAMLIAALITAGGLILCLVDLGRSPWSLVVYGTGVLLIGGASSIYNLARQAYLTEMVPLHMRARALSALGGWMRVGIFAGPFLGAAAIGLIGLPGAYYVSLLATGWPGWASGSSSVEASALPPRRRCGPGSRGHGPGTETRGAGSRRAG